MLSPVIEYKSLSYAERCRRIGALLGRAAVRYYHKRGIERRSRLVAELSRGAESDMDFLVTDTVEKRILGHLASAGHATPQDFCSALKISPATAFRRLARLRNAGLVLVEGKCRAANYRLSEVIEAN